jgi:hypothetical protein
MSKTKIKLDDKDQNAITVILVAIIAIMSFAVTSILGFNDLSAFVAIEVLTLLCFSSLYFIYD